VTSAWWCWAGIPLANVWCELSPSAVGGRMYIDSLIGPDTVTTLPEATIALFED
jgi:hypothetical protein